MNKQALVVGVLHEGAWFAGHTITTVHHTIAVEIIGISVAIGIHDLGGANHRLPGADAIGIGGDLAQSLRSLEIGVGACITAYAEVIGPGVDIGIDE